MGPGYLAQVKIHIPAQSDNLIETGVEVLVDTKHLSLGFSPIPCAAGKDGYPFHLSRH